MKLSVLLLVACVVILTSAATIQNQEVLKRDKRFLLTAALGLGALGAGIVGVKALGASAALGTGAALSAGAALGAGAAVGAGVVGAKALGAGLVGYGLGASHGRYYYGTGPRRYGYYGGYIGGGGGYAGGFGYGYGYGGW